MNAVDAMAGATAASSWRDGLRRISTLFGLVLLLLLGKEEAEKEEDSVLVLRALDNDMVGKGRSAVARDWERTWGKGWEECANR